MLGAIEPKNTLVLFMSDNNAPGGNRNTEFLNSTGPFRGSKGDVSEGGIRVPFLARWPGVVPAGRMSAEPLYFPDLLPTLVEAIGAGLPGKVDGESVWATLTGRKQPPRKAPLYWELRSRKVGRKVGQQAVRDGRWKAVRRDGPVELYDLAADGRESKNVASAHPEVASRLTAAMDAAHVDSVGVSAGVNSAAGPHSLSARDNR